MAVVYANIVYVHQGKNVSTLTFGIIASPTFDICASSQDFYNINN